MDIGVSKIIGAFLEPPGIFMLLCLFLGLGWRKFKQYGFMLLALFLYLLSTGVGVRVLTTNADFPSTLPDTKPEAIVILGGGTLSNQKTGEHTLHPISTMRLLRGYFLFQREPLPLFVSGGTLWGRELPGEGELMRETLIKLGVPEEKIIVEGNARTTWENARLVTTLLRERNIKSFYLVSSQVHLRRALFAFTHFYPESSIIPISAHPIYDRMPLHLIDFLPSSAALSASSMLLHEWWGLLFYRLKAKHFVVQ